MPIKEHEFDDDDKLSPMYGQSIDPGLVFNPTPEEEENLNKYWSGVFKKMEEIKKSPDYIPF